MKGYTLVKKVLEKYHALPGKLSNLFGKTDTWWRSHGYELTRDNPLSNGNLSPVDHVLKMVDQYDAAERGAGKMLAEGLAEELRARFAEATETLDDRAIRRHLNKEFYEAMDELEKSDLVEKSDLELAAADGELAQIETQIGYARAHVRAEQKKRNGGNIKSGTFGAK